jgi:hypothetical protein
MRGTLRKWLVIGFAMLTIVGCDGARRSACNDGLRWLFGSGGSGNGGIVSVSSRIENEADRKYERVESIRALATWLVARRLPAGSKLLRENLTRRKVGVLSIELRDGSTCRSTIMRSVSNGSIYSVEIPDEAGMGSSVLFWFSESTPLPVGDMQPES